MPPQTNWFCCFLLATLTVYAQSLPPAHAVDWTESAAIEHLERSATVTDIRRIAIARNPAIRTQRAKWAAAIERVPQAGSLPDPVLTADYFGEQVETRVGPQKYRYGLSQTVPLPGQRRVAVDVAVSDVHYEHAVYEQTVRQAIANLTVSYHELQYLRGAQTISRQNIELLNHVLNVINTQYATGNALLRDQLKAESQIAQLGYDIALLEELERLEIARINAAMDLPVTTPIGQLALTPVNLDMPSIDRVVTAAAANRPALTAAYAQVEKAGKLVHLSTFENRPRLTLNAMRIETGDAEVGTPPDSGNDPWTIGIKMSLPIWGARNRSRIREAEFERDAAVAHHRQVENETHTEVHTLYFRMANARRLIDLYEKSLIPQAEQAMESAGSWNDGTTTASSGVIETQSVWLNFNLARLRAVTDYQQYRARLDAIVGQPLSNLSRSAEASP